MILFHQTMKCALHMMEEDASIVVAITYEAIFLCIVRPFLKYDCIIAYLDHLHVGLLL
jgi:hypothetical protein